MATIVEPPTKAFPEDWSLADLLDRLGGVPAWRVRLYPFPGTATEQDVIETEARTDRLCELVDGVLVEKGMGFNESEIAVNIAGVLNAFVKKRRLGIVVGESGMMKLLGRQVRIPDVAFVSWDRLPGRKRPKQPIPELAPDLAVEVLSESNTKREMERKLQEYFTAGVRLVWYVDPQTRTARAYTSPDQGKLIAADGVLDGGEVLPGFTLALSDVFPADIEPESQVAM
jgi:Uma2 family endonuclease